jgi:arsenate reductase
MPSRTEKCHSEAPAQPLAGPAMKNPLFVRTIWEGRTPLLSLFPLTQLALISSLRLRMAEQHKFAVLFVCIGNSCRSQMAEGIARLEAPDLLEPASAGLSPLGYVAELSLRTLENNGYYVRGLHSKALTAEALDAADLVINMTGYPRERTFPNYSRVEDWNIADPYGANPEVYQRIFEEIQVKVWELIARLRREVPVRPVKNRAATERN